MITFNRDLNMLPTWTQSLVEVDNSRLPQPCITINSINASVNIIGKTKVNTNLKSNKIQVCFVYNCI